MTYGHGAFWLFVIPQIPQSALNTGVLGDQSALNTGVLGDPVEILGQTPLLAGLVIHPWPECVVG